MASMFPNKKDIIWKVEYTPLPKWAHAHTHTEHHAYFCRSEIYTSDKMTGSTLWLRPLPRVLTKALHGLPQNLHIFKWVSSREVFDCSPESSLTIKTTQQCPQCNRGHFIHSECSFCFEHYTVKNICWCVYSTHHKKIGIIVR